MSKALLKGNQPSTKFLAFQAKSPASTRMTCFILTTLGWASRWWLDVWLWQVTTCGQALWMTAWSSCQRCGSHGVRKNHVSAFIFSITRANLGWPDRSTFPNGQWNKGHITTNLCSFFVSWASQQDFGDHDLMKLAVQTCRNMSECLRLMYGSDVWLDRSCAEQVANLGLACLHGYKELATQSYNSYQPLFPHMPKGHSLDHIFSELKADVVNLPTVQYFLNPLNHSVQISEDWVGKASRISRRCGPPQVIVRTLERGAQGMLFPLACRGVYHLVISFGDAWRKIEKRLQEVARWVLLLDSTWSHCDHWYVPCSRLHQVCWSFVHKYHWLYTWYI